MKLLKERFTRDERFDLLIASIREHKSVNMCDWQVVDRSIGHTGTCVTFEQLHSCGNEACIAGHLALLPEFQATQYCSIDYDGAPLWEDGDDTMDGSCAVDWWLDSDTDATFAMVNGEVYISDKCYDMKGWDKWDETKAIGALEALRNFVDLRSFVSRCNAL